MGLCLFTGSGEWRRGAAGLALQGSDVDADLLLSSVLEPTLPPDDEESPTFRGMQQLVSSGGGDFAPSALEEEELFSALADQDTKMRPITDERGPVSQDTSSERVRQGRFPALVSSSSASGQPRGAGQATEDAASKGNAGPSSLEGAAALKAVIGRLEALVDKVSPSLGESRSEGVTAGQLIRATPPEEVIATLRAAIDLLQAAVERISRKVAESSREEDPAQEASPAGSSLEMARIEGDLASRQSQNVQGDAQDLEPEATGQAQPASQQESQVSAPTGQTVDLGNQLIRWAKAMWNRYAGGQAARDRRAAISAAVRGSSSVRSQGLGTPSQADERVNPRESTEGSAEAMQNLSRGSEGQSDRQSVPEDAPADSSRPSQLAPEDMKRDAEAGEDESGEVRSDSNLGDPSTPGSSGSSGSFRVFGAVLVGPTQGRFTQLQSQQNALTDSGEVKPLSGTNEHGSCMPGPIVKGTAAVAALDSPSLPQLHLSQECQPSAAVIPGGSDCSLSGERALPGMEAAAAQCEGQHQTIEEAAVPAFGQGAKVCSGVQSQDPVLEMLPPDSSALDLDGFVACQRGQGLEHIQSGHAEGEGVLSSADMQLPSTGDETVPTPPGDTQALQPLPRRSMPPAEGSSMVGLPDLQDHIINCSMQASTAPSSFNRAVALETSGTDKSHSSRLQPQCPTVIRSHQPGPVQQLAFQPRPLQCSLLPSATDAPVGCSSIGREGFPDCGSGRASVALRSSEERREESTVWRQLQDFVSDGSLESDPQKAALRDALSAKRPAAEPLSEVAESEANAELGHVVFVANDWHTAPLLLQLKHGILDPANGLELLPGFAGGRHCDTAIITFHRMLQQALRKARTVFCIHNLAYQGRYPAVCPI
jgi:hypothetical protein